MSGMSRRDFFPRLKPSALPSRPPASSSSRRMGEGPEFGSENRAKVGGAGEPPANGAPILTKRTQFVILPRELLLFLGTAEINPNRAPVSVLLARNPAVSFGAGSPPLYRIHASGHSCFPSGPPNLQLHRASGTVSCRQPPATCKVFPLESLLRSVGSQAWPSCLAAGSWSFSGLALGCDDSLRSITYRLHRKFS